jgi:hypothetical protein
MTLQYPKIEPSQLGALPPAVQRGLVEPAAIALQRLLDWSRRVLRLGDNIVLVTLGTAAAPVASGTEFAFSPPFKPVGFTPSHATNTSGAPITITGWKPNLARTDDLVGVTVTLSGASTGIVTGVLWGAN